MSPCKKRIAAQTAIFFLGLMLGAAVWSCLTLPFSNPLEVVGILTQIQFNPANNILRFVVLVCLPSLLLGLFFIFKKGLVIKADAPSAFEGNSDYDRWARLGFWIAFAGSFIPLLVYFSQPLGPPRIDLFHAGEKLTPAWNFVQTGGIWTASYFVHGAFFDVFAPLAGWKIWGQSSIGAYFLVDYFLRAVVPLGIFFFLCSMAKFVVPESERILPRVLFIAVGWFVWTSTWVYYQYTDPRYLPPLLGFSALLLGFPSGRWLWFFAGGSSALCYFYSIDVGAYYLASLVFFLSFLFFTNRKALNAHSIGWLSAGFLLGWCIFVLSLGLLESKEFLRSTLMLYRTKDLYDSFVFVHPLAQGRAVPKWALLGISLLLFTFTQRFLQTRTPNRILYLHFFLCVLSVLFFRSALGRSDDGHIKYASTFIYLGLAFLVWEKLIFLKPRWQFLFLLACLLGSFPSFARRMEGFSFSRILTFPSRSREFASIPDPRFVEERQREGIERLKSLFQNEECLFSLTMDASLPFLVKKPSCSRFFVSWFASARPLREELLRDLTERSPKLIVVSAPNNEQNFDGISNRVRFPEMTAYIDEHYQPFIDAAGWGVWRKRK